MTLQKEGFRLITSTLRTIICMETQAYEIRLHLCCRTRFCFLGLFWIILRTVNRAPPRKKSKRQQKWLMLMNLFRKWPMATIPWSGNGDLRFRADKDRE